MKQEGKKLMVVGALALVLLAVGVFQVLGNRGGNATPVPEPTTEATGQEKTEGGSAENAKAPTGEAGISDAQPPAGQEPGPRAEGEPAQPNRLAMAPLPVRDPFRPGEVRLAEPDPEPAPAPPSPPARRQSPNAPFDLPGATPLNPMITGSLPAVGGALPMGPAMGAPAPQEPVFRLRGVVSGKTPMAVLEDGSGRQRLVEVGGYVDPDSRVVSIQGETVTIVRRGQRKSLTIQEGTVDSR